MFITQADQTVLLDIHKLHLGRFFSSMENSSFIHCDGKALFGANHNLLE